MSVVDRYIPTNGGRAVLRDGTTISLDQFGGRPPTNAEFRDWANRLLEGDRTGGLRMGFSAPATLSVSGVGSEPNVSTNQEVYRLVLKVAIGRDKVGALRAMNDMIVALDNGRVTVAPLLVGICALAGIEVAQLLADAPPQEPGSPSQRRRAIDVG